MIVTSWLKRRLLSLDLNNGSDLRDDSSTVRNIAILVLSTFLTKTADSLANPKITLTALLQSQGAPVQAISLLVPVRESGALLPQAWIGGHIAAFKRLGPFYSMGAAVQGFAALAMLFSAWLLEGAVAGWAILICVGVLSIARALSSISYKAVLGKGVPEGLRGRTTGWATSGAGLAALAIALVLFLIPDDDNIGVLMVFLGIAAVSWWVASALFSAIEEPEQPEQSSKLSTMRVQLAMLRNEHEFRQYIIVRSLMVSSALVAPWYVMLSVSSNNLLAFKPGAGNGGTTGGGVIPGGSTGCGGG